MGLCYVKESHEARSSEIITKCYIMIRINCSFCLVKSTFWKGVPREMVAKPCLLCTPASILFTFEIV